LLSTFFFCVCLFATPKMNLPPGFLFPPVAQIIVTACVFFFGVLFLEPPLPVQPTSATFWRGSRPVRVWAFHDGGWFSRWPDDCFSVLFFGFSFPVRTAGLLRSLFFSVPFLPLEGPFGFPFWWFFGTFSSAPVFWGLFAEGFSVRFFLADLPRAPCITFGSPSGRTGGETTGPLPLDMRRSSLLFSFCDGGSFFFDEESVLVTKPPWHCSADLPLPMSSPLF